MPDLKPAITTGKEQVRIKSGDLSNKIITGGTVQNAWALQLGRGVPLRLTVNAGATQGHYELGGLSLESLVWNQGASAATVNFGQRNPIQLTTFDVTAGASSLTMTGLANANLGTATFKLGAGNLTLAFDGALAQDADDHGRGRGQPPDPDFGRQPGAGGDEREQPQRGDAGGLDGGGGDLRLAGMGHRDRSAHHDPHQPGGRGGDTADQQIGAGLPV